MRIPVAQNVNTISMDEIGDAPGRVRTGEVYWARQGTGLNGQSSRSRKISRGGTGGSTIAAASYPPLAISTFRLRSGVSVRDSEHQNCDTYLE